MPIPIAALGIGLVQGFTKNIQKESSRRDKEDAKFDDMEKMLFASLLKPVDQRPGVDAINAIQNTLRKAKVAQNERDPIDLFGTPSKRIDVDLMKTANLLNEVEGGTLKFGGYKIPVSKLWGSKSLLGKPFEQGQEWLRAVNLHLNNPLQKSKFFMHLNENKEAANYFRNELERHGRLFLNGFTKNFSNEGDKNKAYTQIIDNFANIGDYYRVFGGAEQSPVDTVINHKQLKNKQVQKGVVYFPGQDNKGVKIAIEYGLDNESYGALSNISKRLGYVRPSDFLFDYKKNVSATLMQGEDPRKIFKNIFHSIELEKMGFESNDRDVNKISDYLITNFGDDRYNMALAVMPLLGKIQTYAEFASQNMNHVQQDLRLVEIRRIMDIKNLEEIKTNFRDSLDVKNKLTKLLQIRSNPNMTTAGLVENVASWVKGVFGQDGQISMINVAGETVGSGEDNWDSKRANDAISRFLQRDGSDTQEERLGRIDSLLIDLAARMARAVDPSGRLSNQDFEVQLRRLGSANLFSGKPRSLAALQETLLDFTDRVNRLKVLNDIVEGRSPQGGIKQYLTRSERRMLHADQRITTLLASADQGVVSNVEGQKFTYEGAKNDVVTGTNESRISTTDYYIGPNGEDVEIMFNKQGEQVPNRYFINGKQVNRDQIRYVPRDADTQYFRATETEQNPAKRSPQTLSYVGDDPSTEVESDELREQIKKAPLSSLAPFDKKPKPLSTNQTPPKKVVSKKGEYAESDFDKIIGGLGNGRFNAILDGKEVIIQKESDNSFSIVSTD